MNLRNEDTILYEYEQVMANVIEAESMPIVYGSIEPSALPINKN
jgi:hypothetical protein